jgi:transcription antitermination factor NusG
VYTARLVRDSDKAKQGAVRYEDLSRVLAAVFLPMLKPLASRVCRRSATAVPLFPQTLFARFDITIRYYAIRYMPGVVGFVSVGQEPLALPQAAAESSSHPEGRSFSHRMRSWMFVDSDHRRQIAAAFFSDCKHCDQLAAAH